VLDKCPNPPRILFFKCQGYGPFSSIVSS
jgi:hypothetical protein